MYKLILQQHHLLAKSIHLNRDEVAFLPALPLSSIQKQAIQALGGGKRTAKWWRVPTAALHSVTLRT